MKAAVYVRVSTEEQVDGYSLDAQTRATKAYCEKEKWIPIVFEEQGASGTNTEKRPVFLDMIARCKAHQFDVVLVHKLDRFARNREDAVVFKGLLKREGIRVISVTEQFDDGPVGQLIEGVMECVAQWYSANLSIEVKKGLAERALSGKHHARIPVGYHLGENGIAVIDEQFGPVVKKAFEDYATGTMAVRDIRLAIIEQTGFKIGEKGMAWVLHNPWYIGKMTHNQEVLPGAHEPLVSDAVFNTVQRILSEKGRCGGGAHGMRIYELSTLLLCDCGCGQHMCGKSITTKQGKVWFTYYHVDPAFAKRYKGYIVHAIPAEERVSRLLNRQIRSDWQYRIADIVQKEAVVTVTDNTAEKLERAKELYVAGDITKTEYQALKTQMGEKKAPEPTVDMAALLGVINVSAEAWEQAQPVERWNRNKLLLKWVRIAKDGTMTYEYTNLGKAVYGE